MTEATIVQLHTALTERVSLFERTRILRFEIEQIFIDADHWNSTHQNEERIDSDPGGDLRRLADGLDRMLAAIAKER